MMLVLTREAMVGRDSIEIGNDILIQVLSVKGGRVRIGIKAPQSIGIRRTELPVKSSAERTIRIRKAA